MYVYTLVYVLVYKNSQFTKDHYLKKSKERCVGRFEGRTKKEKMLLHYSFKIVGKKKEKQTKFCSYVGAQMKPDHYLSQDIDSIITDQAGLL